MIYPSPQFFGVSKQIVGCSSWSRMFCGILLLEQGRKRKDFMLNRGAFFLKDRGNGGEVQKEGTAKHRSFQFRIYDGK